MTTRETRLAFYITNELASERLLIESVPITLIENIVKRIIEEFSEKEKEPNRYSSIKVHWLGGDNRAWCHTLAKNPRLTSLSDLVTCRRCLPEATKLEVGKGPDSDEPMADSDFASWQDDPGYW